MRNRKTLRYMRKQRRLPIKPTQNHLPINRDLSLRNIKKWVENTRTNPMENDHSKDGLRKTGRMWETKNTLFIARRSVSQRIHP